MNGEPEKTPLTADEIEDVRKAGENLGIAYWKEVLSMMHVPIRNHHITREAVREAHRKMGEVIAKWV
jgi:protein tyrosine phosphatase (PTP) superfamily phosphohydrolase (DUF442 family)